MRLLGRDDQAVRHRYYRNLAAPLADRAIGWTSGPLLRDQVVDESPLGNVIAQAAPLQPPRHRQDHACELAVMRGDRVCAPVAACAIIARPVTPEELNRRELERYVQRVTDRWPAQRALLGGARVADMQGARSQRERGPEYVIVFVSEHFDGVPWLERVYQTGSLWDAYEMGAPADVHCYTPAEFERKRETMRVVREAAEHGLELLPEPA